jgi:hypothetical protein
MEKDEPCMGFYGTSEQSRYCIGDKFLGFLMPCGT